MSGVYNQYPTQIDDQMYKVLKKYYNGSVKFEISKLVIPEPTGNQTFRPTKTLKSSDKSWFDSCNLIVTSGVIDPKPSLSSPYPAYTDTYNFRMLLHPHNVINSGLLLKIQRIAWENYTFSAMVRIDDWLQPPTGVNIPDWVGVHLFARYNTENDLYVASYRKDGLVVIKKKIAGKYTTLGSIKTSPLQLTTMYHLTFSANRDLLVFYINGSVVLKATDSDLMSGTSGVRFDYAKVYLDSLLIQPPNAAICVE